MSWLGELFRRESVRRFQRGSFSSSGGSLSSVEPSGLAKGRGYWVCIWAGLSFQGLSARTRGRSDELTSLLCCLSCYYNEIPEAGHFEKRGLLSSHVVQALARACLAASHHRRQDRSTCVPGRESLGEGKPDCEEEAGLPFITNSGIPLQNHLCSF